MSGKRSRTKGQRGEREFLAVLGEELGETLTRNLQQTREGGADCIVLKGWAIEVKRQERLSRGAWWRQAVEQAERAGVQPMLAYRRNGEEWRVWIKEGCDLSVAEAAGAIREKWLGEKV
jgi:Holliday junction resolvase